MNMTLAYSIHKSYAYRTELPELLPIGRDILTNIDHFKYARHQLTYSKMSEGLPCESAWQPILQFCFYKYPPSWKWCLINYSCVYETIKL